MKNKEAMINWNTLRVWVQGRGKWGQPRVVRCVWHYGNLAEICLDRSIQQQCSKWWCICLAHQMISLQQLVCESWVWSENCWLIWRDRFSFSRKANLAMVRHTTTLWPLIFLPSAFVLHSDQGITENAGRTLSPCYEGQSILKVIRPSTYVSLCLLKAKRQRATPWKC